MDYFIGQYEGSNLDLPEESIHISLGNYYLYNEEHTNGYFLEEATHSILKDLKIPLESVLVIIEDSNGYEVYVIFFTEGKKVNSILYNKKDFDSIDSFNFILNSLKEDSVTIFDFKLNKSGTKIIASVPSKESESGYESKEYVVKDLNLKIFRPNSDIVRDFISNYIKVIIPFLITLILGLVVNYSLYKYGLEYLHKSIDVKISKSIKQLRKDKKELKTKKSKINLIMKEKKGYKTQRDLLKSNPKEFNNKINQLFSNQD